MATAESRRRVAIVHPWMPHYRVRFFELLRESLAVHGIELLVAHGSDPHFATGRGDSVELGWATRLREFHTTIAGRQVNLRAPWRPALSADLLILEDGLRNLDTYLYLIARKPRAGRQTAFWGHGRTMDRPATARERRLKERLVRAGDWWFAYTRGSADHLASLGLPAERITEVGNTIDCSALVEARSSVDRLTVSRLREEHGLAPGHTALFIGGLSEAKNLAMLVEAARVAAAADPSFRLLVVGDGPDRDVVERAARECPAIRLLGPVFDHGGKAVLAAASDLMVLPGLAGLAVVDAFALGLPPIAVSPWHHAPEFEYLEDGRNCLITAPDAESFAAAIGRLIGDPGLRERLEGECGADAGQFASEAMVGRFSDGVLAALDSAPASR